MSNTTIPFHLGDEVIERIGEGQNAPNHRTKIVHISGDECETETGRLYSRLTGVRIPKSDPYRSITGTAYAGVRR